MARAQGARSQLAAAFETTYGTAPASGFMQMPFASASLGAEQPLLASELLGYSTAVGANRDTRRRRGSSKRCERSREVFDDKQIFRP